MTDELKTQLIFIDGHPLLVVSGEIDMATAPQFEVALKHLAAVTDRSVLDFAGVTFLDSSGIKVLVAASQRTELSSISIRRPSEQIVRTLQICGLAERFLEADPSGGRDQTLAVIDD